MNSYVFMTDSDSDISYQFVDENDVEMVYMPYVVDGVEYPDDLGRSGKQKEYFQRMREGTAPKTSLLPVSAYLELFRAAPEGRQGYSVSRVFLQDVRHPGKRQEGARRNTRWPIPTARS